MRKVVLVPAMCVALATGLGIAGCGGGGDNGGGSSGSSSSTPTATGGGGAVNTAPTMGDNFFKPEGITVKAGNTVTWTNDGAVQHTVTADDGTFDSGLVDPGKTYKQTFKKAGTVSYKCTIHAGMVGKVIVQ